MNEIDEIVFKPIGIIKSSFTQTIGVPIQSKFGRAHIGEVHLKPEYMAGLKDLDGFSHIHLLYFFNRHSDYKLTVRPYLDNNERGLFATRAPKRPNGIGLSTVEIVSIENNVIRFKGCDILNDTPLLDIKPYVADIDVVAESKSGWYANVKKDKNVISDDRF